jgi:UDP-N-acetylglucosamine 2-epimerase (non-hydrolysing)
VRDSLALVDDDGPPAGLAEPFGIVSLHRFELLSNRQALADALGVLRDAAVETPLVFIDHPVTAAAVERFGLGSVFDERSFRRVPRLSFFEFVRLERRCAFVVTDSGGSQEECFYLDRPCLVHRMRTERREGLAENVVLSGLDTDVLREFLDSPSSYRRTSVLPDVSPSDLIVDDLERRAIAVGS